MATLPPAARWSSEAESEQRVGVAGASQPTSKRTRAGAGREEGRRRKEEEGGGRRTKEGRRRREDEAAQGRIHLGWAQRSRRAGDAKQRC